MRSQNLDSRVSERGAALITAVLLSLLLLAAGGTLILTATMTGATARDSTAEMQAYYAAEAGVAKTLEVLRGNVESNPAGTRASFRNVVCSRNLWNTMSGAMINVAGDGSTRFQIGLILDPDNQDANLACNGPNAANYRPDRLVVQVAGFGPRNSRKNMEVIVDRHTVEYDVNAVVTLPNGTANPMDFQLGQSNGNSTLGEDVSGTGATLAAYSVSQVDQNTTNNVMDGCLPNGTNCGNSAEVTPPDPLVLSDTNTPSFLSSVANARTFLYGSEGMMQTAINQGRYFTNEAAAKASVAGLGANNPDGVLTFVDGNFTLGPGNPTGQGTLIVTGNLILDGNFNWNGVIMVLGTGNVLRNGAGHGNIYGAMFVANFTKVGAANDVFGAPTFNTNGGGTSNIQYSSFAVDMAKSVGGHSIRGVREF